MNTLPTSEYYQRGLAKYIPISGWIRKYSSAWLRIDIIAGLTASAVVISQAMEVFQVMELDSKPVIGLLAVQS